MRRLLDSPQSAPPADPLLLPRPPLPAPPPPPSPFIDLAAARVQTPRDCLAPSPVRHCRAALTGAGAGAGAGAQELQATQKRLDVALSRVTRSRPVDSRRAPSNREREGKGRGREGSRGAERASSPLYLGRLAAYGVRGPPRRTYLDPLARSPQG